MTLTPAEAAALYRSGMPACTIAAAATGAFLFPGFPGFSAGAMLGPQATEERSWPCTSSSAARA